MASKKWVWRGAAGSQKRLPTDGTVGGAVTRYRVAASPEPGGRRLLDAEKAEAAVAWPTSAEEVTFLPEDAADAASKAREDAAPAILSGRERKVWTVEVTAPLPVLAERSVTGTRKGGEAVAEQTVKVPSRPRPVAAEAKTAERLTAARSGRAQELVENLTVTGMVLDLVEELGRSES